ncbi:hypothetical protein ACQ4PT_068835 [Festuca glaucescens]
MATTVGVDRELGAPAPVVPPWAPGRQVVQLLGALTASVTFQVGLIPPGKLFSDYGDGRLLHTRYLVLFYCNAIAFVASLAVILLLIVPWNPVSSNQRIKLFVLRVALTLSLLCGIGAYVAVSCLSFITSICVVALAAAVILYIAIQIPLLLCKSVELSSVKVSPQKSRKLIPSKKKKYHQKAEQKNRRQQNIISGQGSGDAYQILKKSRMHMLLLSTLAASVTYQAGLNDISQGEAHYASGDHRILHDKRFLVFYCCNASAFVMSLAIVVILLLSSVFSTQKIKYYCALQVAVTVNLFCLTGALPRPWTGFA